MLIFQGTRGKKYALTSVTNAERFSLHGLSIGRATVPVGVLVISGRHDVMDMLILQQQQHHHHYRRHCMLHSFLTVE
jgi:hypothetical protein